MKDVDLSAAIKIIANLKKGDNRRILLLCNMYIAVRPIIDTIGKIDGCVVCSYPFHEITENTKTLVVQMPSWDDTYFNALKLAEKNQYNVICVGWRADVKDEFFPSNDEFDVYNCVLEEALTVNALIKSLKEYNSQSIVVYNRLGMTGVLFAQTSTNGGVYDFSVEMNYGKFPAYTVGELISRLEALPQNAKIETRIGWPVKVEAFDNVVIIRCQDKALTPRNI
ncbi:MAG: hypothetical protein HDS43_01835 [Bacteroides sp.]|nr:hypothetical protein [Bacteroides sp.]